MNDEIKEVEILLVEDNPGDVALVQLALKDNKIKNKLHVVPDGVEAMKFLRGEDDYVDAPRPDLVLLDLNLPRKNGREVLEEIKSDQKLRSIPVCVLTSSREEEDILRSYDMAANCYITKPVDFEQFAAVVKSVEHFWFTVVKLPFRPHHTTSS